MPRVEGTAVGPNRWTPLITVSLVVVDKTFNFTALVDSGADCTILPAELVEAVGVPFSSLPKSPGSGVGAGGAFEIRVGRGDLIYDGVKFATQFSVAAPKCLASPLLGRSDFMRLFVVRFNWHKTPPEFHIDPAVAPKRGRTRK